MAIVGNSSSPTAGLVGSGVVIGRTPSISPTVVGFMVVRGRRGSTSPSWVVAASPKLVGDLDDLAVVAAAALLEFLLLVIVDQNLRVGQRAIDKA